MNIQAPIPPSGARLDYAPRMFCLTPLHLAYIASHPLPPAPPRVAAADRVTCIEPGQLARAQGLTGTFETTYETEHFLLAWNEGDITEAQVDTYAAALEASWTVQIDTLGWMPPSQTDACRITVLAAEFDKSWGDTGGYTDVNEDGGVPYIVLNVAWLADGEDWTNTLVAHEFNHASQFAYDVFWDETDWWYWESTAEWMADVVYDDADTYTWSLWSYLDAPWRSLESMSATVQYGHFAFNTHLEETWDRDTPRAVWAAAGSGSMDDAVVAVTGAEFTEVVADYSSRVAALDVEERDVWLEAIGYFEMDPWTHVTTYPAEGQVTGRESPQEQGQTFFQLGGAPGGTVHVSVVGEPTVDGVATDLVVTVAEVGADGTSHRWEAGADGVVDVDIEGLGDTLTDVYLAVVPMGDIGEEGVPFDWSITVTPADEDTGAPDEDEAPKACGCATPTSPSWFLALPLLLLVRRR